jgi:hypothetical protein
MQEQLNEYCTRRTASFASVFAPKWRSKRTESAWSPIAAKINADLPICSRSPNTHHREN